MTKEANMKKFLKNTLLFLSAFALIFSVISGVLAVPVSAGKIIDYKVTYTSEKVRITFTPASDSNTIYYTANGSKPTTSSKKYSKTLAATKKVTVRAIEVNDSGKTVASIKITIQPKVSKVKFNITKKDGYKLVKLTSATDGAKIYYTTDGTKPTDLSTPYTEPIKVTETTKIRAVAYKENMKTSTRVTGTVKISNSTSEAASSGDFADYAEEVLYYVNKARKIYGLDPLVLDEKLCEAAEIRAKEIKKDFSHTRPNGKRGLSVIGQVGVLFRAAGENLGHNQRSGESVVSAWLNSEDHRENILSERYSKMGIGFYEYEWCQLFTD